MKGQLIKFQEWLKSKHVSPKLIFFALGITSTIWFLIRVIPKPSRAAYPCMRAAAPFMSGFVIYLISLGGIAMAFRRTKKYFQLSNYLAAVSFLLVALIGLGIVLTHDTLNSFAADPVLTGPEDGPNQPMGVGKGIHPGQVVWVWNPEATNENCTNTLKNQDWYWKPENMNEKVVGTMFRDAVIKLTGKSDVVESWNALFRYHNNKKHSANKGYTKGEKIFIKVNQHNTKAIFKPEDLDYGTFYYPSGLKTEESYKEKFLGSAETGPYIVLEMLRELVYEFRVDQSDIAIGDPISHIYGYNYDIWSKEFPNVVYVDNDSNVRTRTTIQPTAEDLIFYSDKSQTDKLYDVIKNADYFINVANLKAHSSAGVSFNAKNHYGCHTRKGAHHLHYSLVGPFGEDNFTNAGYHKYRGLVDLMGSKYLGQNTLLCIVDGLFGGGSNQQYSVVKFFMPPFSNDWSNSLFVSQDQVAIESVCFDFLRAEWNGINKHDPINNKWESKPNQTGVDDFIHQAADPANWPKNIQYDPDNSGTPISSLGVHEHWNNPVDKQYSGNLGKSNGITLVSIPETLIKGAHSGSSQTVEVKSVGSAIPAKKMNSSVENEKISSSQSSLIAINSLSTGIQAKNFNSSAVDDDNTKWFLTEKGIVSFDDKIWTLHNKNRKAQAKEMKDVAYDASTYGKELWIASTEGATVATIPVDGRSGATTYHRQNSSIASDTVLAVVIGKSPLRWFGTQKGISGFNNNKWLTNSYSRQYPSSMFQAFPITSMATTLNGDSLFVGTVGAGVVRVYRNGVDAISGASEYAQWGPIILPSDNIYSTYVAPDGTQWFGTDMGVAKHTGHKTLQGWTVYNTDNGLADNFVQAIHSDNKGNMWFGTKGGLSVFDGSKWTSYKMEDGLVSNNILTITVDNQNVVWIGTDNGVCRFSNGKFVSYQ